QRKVVDAGRAAHDRAPEAVATVGVPEQLDDQVLGLELGDLEPGVWNRTAAKRRAGKHSRHRGNRRLEVVDHDADVVDAGAGHRASRCRRVAASSSASVAASITTPYWSRAASTLSTPSITSARTRSTGRSRGSP